LSAPTRRYHTTGRDLPPTATVGGLLMTDFPIPRIRAALALACHSQKGMRLS